MMSRFETISEFDRRVRANYTINLCLGIRRRSASAGFPQAPAETMDSARRTGFDTCPGRPEGPPRLAGLRSLDNPIRQELHTKCPVQGFRPFGLPLSFVMMTQFAPNLCKSAVAVCGKRTHAKHLSQVKGFKEQCLRSSEIPLISLCLAGQTQRPGCKPALPRLPRCL